KVDFETSTPTQQVSECMLIPPYTPPCRIGLYALATVRVVEENPASTQALPRSRNQRGYGLRRVKQTYNRTKLTYKGLSLPGARGWLGRAPGIATTLFGLGGASLASRSRASAVQRWVSG
ncbi:hypothetical protein, partial [Thiocystis violacea]|uniref:hypothetical protein n=1 Tax=Thiocystis violacea TaxID=13725 RepID=UPI001F5B5808